MEVLHLQLDSKLGAAFLGNLAAGIFFGITSVQTYIYFRSSYQDSISFKFLVLFLWILDALHLTFITHGLYYYMVSNFANPFALIAPVWSVLAQVYITCISDLIVRLVFARRVWLLSGRKYLLVLLIAIPSALTAVTGFVFTTKAFHSGSFAAFIHISWIMYTALGSGVAADVVIAVSLVALLLKARTGFKRTDSLVNVLMVYTINTGLFTTICTTTCLITYAVWPEEFIFMGVYFSLSTLYLNSLLATLNARKALRDTSHGISTVPIALSDRSDRSSKMPSQLEVASYGEYPGTSLHPKLVIKVDRKVETVLQGQAM